jgi:hypothetical protein
VLSPHVRQCGQFYFANPGRLFRKLYVTMMDYDPVPTDNALTIEIYRNNIGSKNKILEHGSQRHFLFLNTKTIYVLHLRCKKYGENIWKFYRKEKLHKGNSVQSHLSYRHILSVYAVSYDNCIKLQEVDNFSNRTYSESLVFLCISLIICNCIPNALYYTILITFCFF